MAAVSSDKLRRDILDILKDADLTTMSSKKVRLQLAERYGCDLQSRKEEIDGVIMDIISHGPDSSKPPASTSKPSTSSKAKAPAKTANGKNRKSADTDSDDDKSDQDMNCDKESGSDDNEVDDELLARKLQEEESASLRKKSRKPKPTPSPKNIAKKCYVMQRSNKKAEKSEDGTKAKRITKFNEPLLLSPQLAAIMGEQHLPRHTVVKKMWAIVKERNLADPKNKQFMICDEQLMTVFGRRKVRTFGMLKYLSQHMSSSKNAGT